MSHDKKTNSWVACQPVTEISLGSSSADQSFCKTTAAIFSYGLLSDLADLHADLGLCSTHAHFVVSHTFMLKR